MRAGMPALPGWRSQDGAPRRAVDMVRGLCYTQLAEERRALLCNYLSPAGKHPGQAWTSPIPWPKIRLEVRLRRQNAFRVDRERAASELQRAVLDCLQR